MPSQFIQARNYTSGRLKKIRLIVIHDMEAPEAADTAENVAKWFAGSSAPQASAHYCIDSDSVVQSVRARDTAWHCPNANADGLGYEHAGFAKQTRRDWTDEFSRKTLALSAKRAAKDCKAYGIRVRRLTASQIRDGVSTGFAGHVDVSRAFNTPGGHVDPGPNFPWDVYLKMVQAELDALNGNPWTSAKVKAAAASVGMVASVFAGVTITTAPAPKPPAVVKTVTATAKPVVKPSPSPTATKPASGTKTVVVKPAKTLGAFPLAKGQWYGADVALSANHSGYRATDRAAIAKIQKAVGATPDGRFGPATKAKVVAKQKALRISADGRVGSQTWSLLRLP